MKLNKHYNNKYICRVYSWVVPINKLLSIPKYIQCGMCYLINKSVNSQGTWMGFTDCKFIVDYLKEKIVLLDFSKGQGTEFSSIIFGQRNQGCRQPIRGRS